MENDAHKPSSESPNHVDLPAHTTDVSELASSLTNYASAVRDVAERRFLAAARKLRSGTTLSLIDTLRATALSIERVQLENRVRAGELQARLTYQRDLEASLASAGLRWTGTWPSYVVEDVLRLELTSDRTAARADGKRIEAIEPPDIAAELRARIGRLVDRPFDRESFLAILRDAYVEAISSVDVAPAGYVDIRRVFLAVKNAMARDWLDRRYTEAKFCIDLYRLLKNGPARHNNHMLELAPAQSSSRGLFIPAHDGGNFVAAVRFVEQADGA